MRCLFSVGRGATTRSVHFTDGVIPLNLQVTEAFGTVDILVNNAGANGLEPVRDRLTD